MQETRQIGLLFVAAAARRNTREEGERDERSKSSTHRGRATDGKSEEKWSSCTVVIGVVVGRLGRSREAGRSGGANQGRTERTNDAKTTASRRTKDAYEGGGRGGGGDQRTESEREREGRGTEQDNCLSWYTAGWQPERAGRGRQKGRGSPVRGRSGRQAERAGHSRAGPGKVGQVGDNFIRAPSGGLRRAGSEARVYR
ncbi:unnamed protein product [Calypogeia fissa]